MARKFQFPNNGTYAWNPERCEDTLIACAYEEIKPNVAPADLWQPEFENHFYVNGSAVTFYDLDQINSVRRRKGLTAIELRETNISDYARTRETKPLKVEHRQSIRDRWRNMTKIEKEQTIAYAQNEVDHLPPPHQTFNEWNEWKEWKENGTADPEGLTMTEVKRRAVAAIRAPKPTPEPPPVAPEAPAEKAARMLALVTDPALREEIIGRLSGDDALEVAEKCEGDKDLRDALVRRALG